MRKPEYINISIKRRNVIYDDKVRATTNGRGMIRLNDAYLGGRAYVVFPLYRKNSGENILVAVDEILNKGIHPNNDHTSRILLGREYVGRKCILVLQD